MTDLIRTAEEARRFVLQERARCVSDREWKHRLAGYGFAIRGGAGEERLTTLPQGQELGALYA